MAKLQQGILGAFSGRVGTVVGYTWRGLPCVRAYRRDVAYPNTPMQQAERDWFVSMVRLASKARAALKLGLREASMREHMTEGNYFVMSNKRCFTQADGQVKVDYARLTLAEGPAAPVAFQAPRMEAYEVVNVDFEKNSHLLNASPEDSVYLFAYAPSLGEGYLSAPARRRSKVLKTSLPQHWAGAEVHLYGFVVDRDGRASCSYHIGSGTVSHPSNNGSWGQNTLEQSDSMQLDMNSNPLEANPPAPSPTLPAPSRQSAADPPEVP